MTWPGDSLRDNFRLHVKKVDYSPELPGMLDWSGLMTGLRIDIPRSDGA